MLVIGNCISGCDKVDDSAVVINQIDATLMITFVMHKMLELNKAGHSSVYPEKGTLMMFLCFTYISPQ